MLPNKLILAVLIVGISVVGLSIGATIPVVALRLHEADIPNLTIGILSALPAAGMLVTAFIVEWLTARLGRKHIYLLCFFLSMISIAMLEVFRTELIPLGLFRFLMGVGAGLIVILGEAWVNEIADESNRGRVVSLYATFFTGFQLLGPAMVSALGPSSAWVTGIVLAIFAVCLLATARFLPNPIVGKTTVEQKTFTVLGFLKVAPAICAGVVFFSFFDSVVLSMFPVFALSHGYEVALAALMATVILLGDTCLQYPLGCLSDRFNRNHLYLGCGLIALLIGLALPWLIQMQALLWPVLVILGAVAGGVYTLAITLIGQHFQGQDLITANASAGFLWGMGSLAGPILSGAAMSAGPNGLPLVLAAAAGLFVLCALKARGGCALRLEQHD
nr:MFS transporter [Pseudomonas luteola]